LDFESPEEGPRVNGMIPNQAKMVVPEIPQTTTMEQPQEGTVEDVTNWAEEYAKERKMEVGTSSQPPQRKGK
jgi:hypothetical protein